MIYIQSKSIVQAARQSLIATLEQHANSSDPTILHEATAVIEVTNTGSQAPAFTIRDNTFAYQLDYQEYIPRIQPSLVSDEEVDYTKLFLASGQLQSLIDNLKQYPDSRRAVTSSWSPICLNPNEVGVCISQLYCRLRNGQLELHSHARANDAYRLLLLDMQLATSMQYAVAQAIGAPVGIFVHFIDSLHCYKIYEQDIDEQVSYMQTAAIWQ